LADLLNRAFEAKFDVEILRGFTKALQVNDDITSLPSFTLFATWWNNRDAKDTQTRSRSRSRSRDSGTSRSGPGSGSGSGFGSGWGRRSQPIGTYHEVSADDYLLWRYRRFLESCFWRTS
jgi:hypothetical protein